MKAVANFARQHPRSIAWILIAISLVVLLPGNSRLPLIDRDEPRFAQATREMMEGDNANWLIPYLNGDYRFDKPILIYWMMRVSYQVFGINEFAARLPSVICAVFLVLLVYHLGRRWFSAPTGFLAALGYVTCLQLVMHGRAAVADMPMLLAVAVSHYAIFELLRESPTAPRRWFWWLYLSLGLGFLAKGPVALALPALTLILYRWVFGRRPLPWRHLQVLTGLLIVVAIIGCWGLPALLATDGEFWRVGIGKHVIERGQSGSEGHGGAVLYYLGTAFMSLFPWIGLAGATGVAVRRQWNPANAFLLSWIVGTYVLFSFYATKLPHYVLPAFPAVFLMFGQLADANGQWPRWTRIIFWAVMAVALTLVVGLFVLAHWLPFGAVAYALGAMIVALVALAVLLRHEQLALAGGAVIGLGLAILWFSSALRANTAVMKLVPVFDQQPAQTERAAYRFGEPSLLFYGGTGWKFLDQDEIEDFAKRTGPRLLVVQEQEWRPSGPQDHWVREKDYTAEFPATLPGHPRETVVEGLNIARGCWVRLRAYTWEN